MMGAISHWPVVKKRAEFLRRMMVELAGDARISLEGDLSRCRFPEEIVFGCDETAVLRRQASEEYPSDDDFIVLRLEADTVEPAFKQIMAAGLKEAIVHVQIERGGVLELGAYDNFHRQCVVTGPGVSAALLAELKSDGILRGFSVATEADGSQS